MSLPLSIIASQIPGGSGIGERRIVLLTGDLLAALLTLGVALYVWGSRLRFIQFDCGNSCGSEFRIRFYFFH